MSGQTVWLASYPKSGSTWVRAVWTGYHTGAMPDVNEMEGGPIASQRASFDAALGLASSDLTAQEIDRLRPLADEALGAADVDLRLRKVHDALLPGPDGHPVVSMAVARAVLYVVRDPRDVAVSFAHHLGCPPARAVARMGSSAATFGGRADGLSGQFRQRLGSWSDHVRSWTGQASVPVHVVRYEDLIDQPAASFSKAFQAVGVGPLDGDTLDAAVEGSAFDRLRDQEMQSGFRERGHATSPFFRQGRAGVWRQELAPDLARRIEAQHGEMMDRFGYQ